MITEQPSYTRGTAADILATLAPFDLTDVELVVELPSRQVFREGPNDETVIDYVPRSETFHGILWGARQSGSAVAVCIGTRQVHIRGNSPVASGCGFTVTELPNTHETCA